MSYYNYGYWIFRVVVWYSDVLLYMREVEYIYRINRRIHTQRVCIRLVERFG